MYDLDIIIVYGYGRIRVPARRYSRFRKRFTGSAPFLLFEHPVPSSREALPSSEPALLRSRRHHVVQGLSDGRRIPQTRYALELHIRRPGRQAREDHRGPEDQARFAGVCERDPPARYAARRRVYPPGVYRMDAELRARILLPAQHQRGKYPFRPHTNRRNLYFRSGNRAVRRCGRTTHTRRGSRLRTVRPERQTDRGRTTENLRDRGPVR